VAPQHSIFSLEVNNKDNKHCLLTATPK